WIEGLGVPLKLEPSGKYFPMSDDAHTVLAALVRRAEELGVEMRSGARVIRLERGWRLGIQQVRDSNPFSAQVARYREGAWPLPAAEPDEWAAAGRVILATGGLSFPRTGSGGNRIRIGVGHGPHARPARAGAHALVGRGLSVARGSGDHHRGRVDSARRRAGERACAGLSPHHALWLQRSRGFGSVALLAARRGL